MPAPRPPSISKSISSATAEVIAWTASRFALLSGVREGRDCNDGVAGLPDTSGPPSAAYVEAGLQPPGRTSKLILVAQRWPIASCLSGGADLRWSCHVRHLEASLTHDPTSEVPIIDVAPLVADAGDQKAVAAAIRQACTKNGFFYAIGHGVSEDLNQRLEELSHRFFAQDVETKLEIRMALAGKAWRGYFPVGDELTSGKPDVKEGLYFGSQLSEDDPRVRACLPLHGPNLFPAGIPGFRDTILEYMAALTGLGHALMRGMAFSLGLEPGYFRERYMADPLTLFRVFHYPPVTLKPDAEEQWGVGEHTDYGVLTILKQDDVGGLQVKTRSR